MHACLPGGLPCYTCMCVCGYADHVCEAICPSSWMDIHPHIVLDAMSCQTCVRRSSGRPYESTPLAVCPMGILHPPIHPWSWPCMHARTYATAATLTCLYVCMEQGGGRAGGRGSSVAVDSQDFLFRVGKCASHRSCVPKPVPTYRSLQTQPGRLPCPALPLCLWCS